MANAALLLVAMLVVGGCAAPASATTTYTVGDSQGWTTTGDYTSWASGKSFVVGDQLVFKYMSKAHTVTEVSKSGYDACSATNNELSDDDSGSTVVTLQTPGTHYFICNVPTHCASGMKLAVAVSATPSGATPSAAALQVQVVPAMASVVVAAAAGAAIRLALF